MAISSSVSEAAPTWVVQYARDHTIHFLVVAVLLIYPGIYHFIAGAEGTTVGKLLFPSMRTMVALFAVALFAISFDFISGYTGYLSFGHSMFFGFGVFFILAVQKQEEYGFVSWVSADMPFMMLLLIAAVISAIVALLIGAVSFRLTGVYFAMITLGFAELATLIAEDEFGQSGDTLASDYTPQIGIPYIDGLTLPAGPNVLKGSQGIFATLGDAEPAKPIYVGDIPVVGQLLDVANFIPVLNNYVVTNPQLVGTDLTYYLIGGVALVSYLIMQRVIHSPFGRVMIAIRENEERAKAIGYNTFIFKMGAFAISAFFASVAGSLFVVFRQAGVPARDFGVISRAGEALLATIIGGIGTLAGPFFGYLFDFNVREFLGERGNAGLEQFLRDNAPGVLETQLPGTTVGEIIGVWFSGSAGMYIGLIFVAFILFVPGGLLGTIRLLMGGKIAKQFPGWVANRVESVRSQIEART